MTRRTHYPSSIAELDALLAAATDPAEIAAIEARIANRRYHNAKSRDAQRVRQAEAEQDRRLSTALKETA